jgi:hypothetical protein
MFLSYSDPHPDPLDRGTDPYQNVTDTQHCLGDKYLKVCIEKPLEKALVGIRVHGSQSPTAGPVLTPASQKMCDATIHQSTKITKSINVNTADGIRLYVTFGTPRPIF